MISPRQRLRRFRARKGRPDRLAEQTRLAKQEVLGTATREGEDERRRGAARVRVEGLSLERLVATVATLIGGALRATRRALEPVVAAIEATLGWIAPPIMRTLGFILAASVTLLATVLDLLQAAGGWLGRRLRAIMRTVGAALEAAVTPARAVAFVALAASAMLAVSQFVDYHGVAVSVPQYAGEIGTIADAPLTDLETTGSAHLYLLIPAALAAIALTLLTLRGRWRLGYLVGLIGLAGIAVALIVDLPQGLDAGRAGVSYEGSEARLIEGFWAQLSACAALVLCGPLLGRYVRLSAGAPSRGGRGPQEDGPRKAPPRDPSRDSFRLPRQRPHSAKGGTVEAGT